MTAHRISRRAWLAAVAAAVPGAAFAQRPSPIGVVPFDVRVREIEARLGGRIGAAFWDVHDGRRGAYRADDRFPMCSTFKLVAAAGVLAHIDAGRERLDRVVHYGQDRVLEYAPVTKLHVRGGMTVEALCAAAVEQSDNTAGNLLLDILGGPAGFTAFARSLGDPVTRLDRTEPSLNSAETGDVRDTTSARAMLETMHRLLIDPRALSAASRERLQNWMVACVTGKDRLRAGLPAAWRVGDKTGTGAHGAANDLAIVWPSRRKPILIAVYTVGSSASATAHNKAIAEVGRLLRP